MMTYITTCKAIPVFIELRCCSWVLVIYKLNIILANLAVNYQSDEIILILLDFFQCRCQRERKARLPVRKIAERAAITGPM